MASRCQHRILCGAVPGRVSPQGTPKLLQGHAEAVRHGEKTSSIYVRATVHHDQPKALTVARHSGPAEDK